MTDAHAHCAATAAHAAALARGATRGEASRAYYVAREAAYGHSDADERGDLVGQVIVAGLMRGIPRDALEVTCVLDEGALSDGTVPTAELRAVLTALREAPRCAALPEVPR